MVSMTDDEKYMHRCVQLAKAGRQNAAPNPMVGAVIVSEDGIIIGEGYHERCGEGHAEVNAFASVLPEDEPLLKNATMYVSLEPCSHYGKTPPCADLIIRKGVRKVVVGVIDPFAEVQGRGIQRLRDAGIDVKVGVCEDECRELNKVFFTCHSLHRPFVTLKWAMTADGVIGVADGSTDGQRLIISNDLTDVLCHKRRAEHQAILVGHNTWLHDRPRLDVRHWAGRNPMRIVLGKGIPDVPGWKVWDGSIRELLGWLHAEGIQSLLVEGGRQTLQSFIDEGLWDEAYVEKAPCLTLTQTFLTETGSSMKSVMAPEIHDYALLEETRFGGHTITRYVNGFTEKKQTTNQNQ